MRRILLIFLAVWALPGHALADKPTILWAEKFRHDDSHEEPRGIAVDSQSNAIVVGDSFDHGFVAKFDPNGQVLWKVGLQEIFPDAKRYRQAWAVAIDPNDNIVVTANANTRLCILKFSPQGKLLDSYVHGHDRYAGRADIVSTKDGFIVGGRAREGFRNKNPKNTTWTLLAKLGPDLQFGKTIDNDRTKTPIAGWARHVDSAKKLISGVSIGPGEDVAVVGEVSVTGDSHIYLQLRRESLGVKWTKRIDLPREVEGQESERADADTDYPKVACDARGNIYVAWDCWRPNRYMEWVHVKSRVSMYDSSGELKWDHLTKSDGSAKDIEVGKDHIAYVAAALAKRPVLLRYTSKPHVAPPLYVFPKERKMTGSSNAVAVAPDGTIYVAGQVKDIAQGDDLSREKEPTTGGPWDVYAGGFVCFVARIAVTEEAAKLFATKEQEPPSESPESILFGKVSSMEEAAEKRRTTNEELLANVDALIAKAKAVVSERHGSDGIYTLLNRKGGGWGKRRSFLEYDEPGTPQHLESIKEFEDRLSYLIAIYEGKTDPNDPYRKAYALMTLIEEKFGDSSLIQRMEIAETLTNPDLGEDFHARNARQWEESLTEEIEILSELDE